MRKRFIFSVSILCAIFLYISSCCFILNGFNFAKAQMPFYNLQPHKLQLRSSFYTSFNSSLIERTHNIKLCAKKLNNTLVDIGGEFSFNETVGERSEKNGFKNAKIIVGGKFVDGLGGGVCQVSTTLYNAVLLAGLNVIEYHPHSLAVSYIAPSFDAMVSYPYADLKFINNTNNPLIILAKIIDNRIKIEIMGEKSEYSYQRISEVKEEINCNEFVEIEDKLNEYPYLGKCEKKVISYPKNGLKSDGKLVKMQNGNVVEEKTIRKDFYKPTKGIIVKVNG